MSPIEKKLHDAIVANVPENCLLFDENNEEQEQTAAPIDTYVEVMLSTQVVVLTYKLDLVLEVMGTRLAVECDGFEWHERSKEQAMADRSRDRALLRAGVRTMRFLGSEIHHFSKRCAAEVFAMVEVIGKEHEEHLDSWHKGRTSGEESGFEAGARARKVYELTKGVSTFLLPECC